MYLADENKEKELYCQKATGTRREEGRISPEIELNDASMRSRADSSRPLNGIVKPFLFFDSSIGNRITFASRSMCLCSSFFDAPLLIPVR